MRENNFYIFVPTDLDFKFAPMVTLVQCYVSTKLEVFTAFSFRENRRHRTDGQTDRRTDRVQRLMRPPRDGRIIADRIVYLKICRYVFAAVPSRNLEILSPTVHLPPPIDCTS